MAACRSDHVDGLEVGVFVKGHQGRNAAGADPGDGGLAQRHAPGRLRPHAQRPGDHGLDGGYMAEHHHVALGGLGSQLGTGPFDPGLQVGQALPAGGHEAGIATPAGPHVSTHVAHRDPVERAVIQLDEPFVDLHRQPQRRRSLTGPLQGTGDHPGRHQRRQRRGDGPGLLLPHRVQRVVDAALQEAGGVSHRAAVSNQDQHVRSCPTVTVTVIGTVVNVMTRPDPGPGGPG